MPAGKAAVLDTRAPRTVLRDPGERVCANEGAHVHVLTQGMRHRAVRGGPVQPPPLTPAVSVN